MSVENADGLDFTSQGNVAVLDGGPCAIGLESTVVDLCGASPALLRQGGITEEELTAVVGKLATGDGGQPDAPRSPGQLLSHYAPDRRLRIDAQSVAPDEALLAFGPAPLPGAAITENLSATGDLAEAAANLFVMLRLLDRPEIAGIAALTVPDRGIGRAINDRLRRAAAAG